MTETLRYAEEIPPVISLPEETVDLFLESERETEVAMHEFERPEKIPGVQGISQLSVLYEKYENSTVRFNYLNIPPGTEHQYLLATMILDISNPGAYTLFHRDVAAEHNKGLGTALLRQVEDFVAQMATRRHEPITLSADMSQYDVIKWLTKLGYEPTDDSRGLYNDIMANVGNTDKYIVNPKPEGIHKAFAIYARTPKGEAQATAIRLTMQKVINPR